MPRGGNPNMFLIGVVLRVIVATAGWVSRDATSGIWRLAHAVRSTVTQSPAAPSPFASSISTRPNAGSMRYIQSNEHARLRSSAWRRALLKSASMAHIFTIAWARFD
jgi:hypothetical protein